MLYQYLEKKYDRYFKPNKKEREIINDHIIQADSLKVMRMINDMNTRGDTNENIG